MDDQSSSYAPRSPDLSAYQSTPPPGGPSPSSFSPLPPSSASPSSHPQHQPYQPPSFSPNASYGQQQQQHQHHQQQQQLLLQQQQQQQQAGYHLSAGPPPTHLAPPQQHQPQQSYYAPLHPHKPYVQAQYHQYPENTSMLASPIQGGGGGGDGGGPPMRRGPEADEEWTPDQQHQGQQQGGAGAGGVGAVGGGGGGGGRGRAGRGPGRKPKKQKIEPDYGSKPAPGVEEGIEVKTKFPVARIKRIMQADDDVGKVAQVTPTAVSKALELFMISLVTKAAAQARSKQAKKVSGAHLKQVIQQDDQFDFLADIVANVPDAPVSGKRAKEGATTGEDDSEGGGLASEAAGKRRKGKSRRKVKDEDDDF